MRRVGTWPWVTDAAIVAALLASNAVLVAMAAETPAMARLWDNPAAGYTVGTLLALLLFARRYAPLAVLILLTAGGLLADYAQVMVWGAASLGIAVASYSVGRYLPMVRALWGLGLGTAANIATTLLSPAQSAPDHGNPWWINQAFYLGWILASWWVGRLVRMRSFHMIELATRAERLERARDAHTRAVLAEERSRIARELHDVVAHHVSVMTVQATAGRRVIERSPERARQTLTEIEGTGRQALAEMRRIVSVLRMPEGDRADTDRGPQPGLAGLTELVQQIRDTGTPVELIAEGTVRDLEPGLELALYRIVQESLTNVLKHAGRNAPATVRVHYGLRAVAITVTDEGGPTSEGSSSSPTDEPGHGLVGMRERVALYGGELAAGPRSGGGFEVSARLPLGHRG
ncbi:sensor histidine kinase [Streptomonospora sediminis]